MESESEGRQVTTYHYAMPKTHQALSGFDRVKVDQGQTNFFLGRQFRAFKELSIPSGTSLVIRAVTTIPIILMAAEVSIDSGWLKVSTVSGGAAGGTFTPESTVFNMNNMPVGVDKLESPVPTVTVASGGTHTGGVLLDVLRIKVANNSNFGSSVNSGEDLARGVSPGTYYYVLENLGPDTVTGVWRVAWEDRPQG